MSEGKELSWMDHLLAAMAAWGASDLFVTEGKPPAVRVQGTVHPVKKQATSAEDLGGWIETAFTAQQVRHFREVGDLDAGYTLRDGRRFRVNLSRQRAGTSIVARAVPYADIDLDQLGLPPAVAQLTEAPRGLVLVTGTTGSGKSTTLTALVHRINRTRPAHIVTIEDPIEFLHKDAKARITQREVGSDTVSFEAGLKNVLRQSPDVVMLGEIRDRETASVAIQAALTGHLILATLHTIDASQTVQRILSMFPEQIQDEVALHLSMCLEGIVSQRLVPAAEGNGRVLAVEVLTRTPAVAQLLREQRIDDLVDLMKGSSDGAITTFNQSLLRLFRDGKVLYDVARAHSTSPDEFALHARGMRSGVESLQEDKAKPAAKSALDRSTSRTGVQDVDIKTLLGQALQKGASDLHLAVGRPPILRIAGELQPLDMTPLTTADMRVLLYSIMTVRQRSAFELDREMDFALAFENGQRFRVNAYYQKGEIACALRAIPSRVPDADMLRIPPAVLDLGKKPHGLLLVVGPTGSGKTTTLACLVDRINRTRACRIITIEDPIEYVHEAQQSTVDQREVYADTKSFTSALKYILRQDPDVILVGEMRDFETISAAMAAAETGHLVLATLHTNDAIQTIDRIIDAFPPHQQEQARSQLAASLVGVVSQRLLPWAKDPDRRVPLFEIMIANPGIRNLIREGKMHQAQSIMETGRADGMLTMDASLKRLLDDGEIAYEDALRYVKNARVLGPPRLGIG
jgi:pilus retraction protein PilT